MWKQSFPVLYWFVKLLPLITLWFGFPRTACIFSERSVLRSENAMDTMSRSVALAQCVTLMYIHCRSGWTIVRVGEERIDSNGNKKRNNPSWLMLHSADLCQFPFFRIFYTWPETFPEAKFALQPYIALSI